MARASAISEDARLLTSVAEQLRLLLLQVARSSELLSSDAVPSEQQIADLRQGTQFGLKLVDHYLLGMQHYDGQLALQLEPVSISALLHEVAQELLPIAKSYDVELELAIAGKYAPVMADRALFKSALASLGYGFITKDFTAKKPSVALGVHKTPKGLVSGIYADESLSSDDLQRGKLLYGKASQPLPAMTTASGAGIFVADSLLSAMGTNLRSSKFRGKYGLGATFSSSGQLSFL